MGVIDSTTHTLKCQCGASEAVRIAEYGSAYGSAWGDTKPFKEFDVTWGASGPSGPMIATARCVNCGHTPVIAIT